MAVVEREVSIPISIWRGYRLIDSAEDDAAAPGARALGRAVLGAEQDHGRGLRLERKGGHGLAARRDPAGRVQCSKRFQLPARRGNRRRRGRVEPTQRSGIGSAPLRRPQDQRREIGRHDLGRIEGRTARMRRLFPEAIDRARPLARGATGARSPRLSTIS